MNALFLKSRGSLEFKYSGKGHVSWNKRKCVFFLVQQYLQMVFHMTYLWASHVWSKAGIGLVPIRSIRSLRHSSCNLAERLSGGWLPLQFRLLPKTVHINPKITLSRLTNLDTDKVWEIKWYACDILKMGVINARGQNPTTEKQFYFSIAFLPSTSNLNIIFL
jgi:hypothetical protein